mmetsp:Transcript_131915/g.186154  ORF Transcript_131915/g.186154 Transcript_131915/m.186154 type:complete len:98 (-) Transcript_131915:487-780(-)
MHCLAPPSISADFGSTPSDAHALQHGRGRIHWYAQLSSLQDRDIYTRVAARQGQQGDSGSTRTRAAVSAFAPSSAVVPGRVAPRSLHCEKGRELMQL